MKRVFSLAFALRVALAGSALIAATASQATPFGVTNIVTDDQAALAASSAGIYGPTQLPDDPNLINPWGISVRGTSPFWVSDNGAGVSTLYNGTSVVNPLVVAIQPTTLPLPSPLLSTPTGTVGNSTTDFKVGGVASTFIFATEDGTIAARTNGTTAVTMVPAGDPLTGAVYKGLAIGQATIATTTPPGTVTGNFLYAANFRSGKIDVFDGNFQKVSLAAGIFTDPTLPAGYAPFNVQVIGTKLYVTYALQDAAKHDDVAGAGNGFVDSYDLDGTNRQRVASGGVLDSPWGLDMAPASFGQFANDLLVGNFGDGTINVFSPTGGGLLGTLHDLSGNPIVIDDLWALINGDNNAAGRFTNDVYFTAGIGDEQHGLFGVIAATPESSTLAMFGFGLLGLGFMMRKRTLDCGE